MELISGIQAIDLGIWLSNSKTLVFCDFHLGYESELQQKGVLVPRMMYKDIIDRLEGIFSRINEPIETIVINGDLKHEFGCISSQEWQEVMRLIDYLERKCNRIVLIKGNHDTILGPIADKQKIEIVEEFVIGSIDEKGEKKSNADEQKSILITHGHKLPSSLKDVIIIGHEHPAISLQEEVRREKYKCYLVGKYKKSKLLVQPSFNLLTEGTDVISQNLLSPLLQDIGDFNVFVADEKRKKILEFGKVREFEQIFDLEKKSE